MNLYVDMIFSDGTTTVEVVVIINYPLKDWVFIQVDKKCSPLKQQKQLHRIK